MSSAPPLEALSLLTLNTWFSDRDRAVRLDAQLAMLEASDADVIGLQEVTADLLERLQGAPWVQARYTLPPEPAGPLRSHGYGVVLLVKRALAPKRFRWHPFDSQMGRGLLVAELGGGVEVGTVHLESMRIHHAARTAQLEACAGHLQGADTAVLMGDFNFDDGDAHPSPLGPFVDLWAAGRPHDPGYTCDELANEMARRERAPQRRRIDRITLLDRTASWRLGEIRVIADEAVAPGVWPSDHFGVTARLLRGPGRADPQA